eukprot:TRINITY_DN23349_c0_g1_i1.p1 TRINITY_DN23349_c0_g1~~TRINITY_DN23349_c0_g1_i1.p1  ORF type:complete len:195 (-),score=38.73 TRINITY_DN23349_c0_g1_i1:21-605(-)
MMNSLQRTTGPWLKAFGARYTTEATKAASGEGQLVELYNRPLGKQRSIGFLIYGSVLFISGSAVAIIVKSNHEEMKNKRRALTILSSIALTVPFFMIPIWLKYIQGYGSKLFLDPVRKSLTVETLHYLPWKTIRQDFAISRIVPPMLRTVSHQLILKPNTGKRYTSFIFEEKESYFKNKQLFLQVLEGKFPHNK